MADQYKEGEEVELHLGDESYELKKKSWISIQFRKIALLGLGLGQSSNKLNLIEFRDFHQSESWECNYHNVA